MKRSEAQELLTKIHTVVTHARSMIREGTGAYHDEPMMRVIRMISPTLFPKDETIDGYGLPQVIWKMRNKGDDLEPIDLYNLLIMIRKEPAVEMLCEMRHIKLPSEGLHPWLTGWENEGE